MVGPLQSWPNGAVCELGRHRFSHDLNGYLSVKARKTRSGGGKDVPIYRRRDISKTRLDVHLVPLGKPARVTNDPAGFKALTAWIDRPIRCLRLRIHRALSPCFRAGTAFRQAMG